MKTELNKWEIRFKDLLYLLEFELNKYEDGYGLIDGQGANLGDIEEDRFLDAAQIIDRLDEYIDNCLIEDLLEALKGVGINVKEMKITPWATNLLPICRNNLSEEWEPEIETLDMICNHIMEVNIDNVYDSVYADN